MKTIHIIPLDHSRYTVPPATSTLPYHMPRGTLQKLLISLKNHDHNEKIAAASLLRSMFLHLYESTYAPTDANGEAMRDCLVLAGTLWTSHVGQHTAVRFPNRNSLRDREDRHLHPEAPMILLLKIIAILAGWFVLAFVIGWLFGKFADVGRGRGDE